MGGALRHNAELLPRVATLIESAGGGLSVMEGSKPVSFPLPASVSWPLLREHLATTDVELVISTLDRGTG